MKRKQEPTRLEILEKIFECLQQVAQWVPNGGAELSYSEGVTKDLTKPRP